MRLTRRQFGALALGGSAMMLLSACNQTGGQTGGPAGGAAATSAPKPAEPTPAAKAPAGGATAAPAAKTTGGTGGGAVTFVTSLAEDERAAVGDVLKAFQNSAGIEVKMVQMESQDVVNQLRAKQQANRMDVDLIAQDNLRLGPLVRDQIVEDLSGEQARVPDTTIDTLKPVTQFDGKSFFFPYRPNVQIAYFNEPQFSANNIKPPETWDDLLKAAQTLKEKEGIGKVAIQGSAGDPLTVSVFEFIKAAGGDPLVLNDEGSVKAFEFMAQLEPLMTPEYRTAKFDTMNTMLSNDTAYLGRNWPFGITVIVEKNGRKDIKAYRGWKGPAKESHVLGGEVLGIPVGAPNRAGALQLAEFLMSKDAQGQLLTKLGWPPMRTDAFGTVQAEWQKPYFEAVQEALKNTDARPNVPYWEEASRAMNDAFRDIVQQRQPAKETLDRYASALQQAKKAAGA